MEILTESSMDSQEFELLWMRPFRGAFWHKVVILLLMLMVIPVKSVHAGEAMDKSPLSVTFSFGEHFLPDSPYRAASGMSSRGEEVDFLALTFRVNPSWAIGLGTPLYGPEESLGAGQFQEILVSLYSIVPQYFFIRRPEWTGRAFELYGGAGPAYYREVVAERPGLRVATKHTGAVALVGGELRNRGLGIVLDAKYYFVPDVSTPLGTLKAGGLSINFGLRFHFLFEKSS